MSRSCLLLKNELVSVGPKNVHKLLEKNWVFNGTMYPNNTDDKNTTCVFY